MTKKTPVSAAWSCHTPNLLCEILCNPGMDIMTKPLQIFGHILSEVADRAIELDDPRLNLLMLRLTLYEAADLDLPHVTPESLQEAIDGQEARIAEEKSSG